MKVATNRAVLLKPKELLGPLHKLKLGIGNSATTTCDLFTAAGHLVVKTNTGDLRAPAEGELWPPVPIRMRTLKLIAKMYAKSAVPIEFERTGNGLRVGTTVFQL